MGNEKRDMPDGYYWAQFPDSKPFPRLVCAAWGQEPAKDLAFGPRIPPPEVLARVEEFLRRVEDLGKDFSDQHTGAYAVFHEWSKRASALLAELTKGAK